MMIGVEKYIDIITNGVDSTESVPRQSIIQTLNVTPSTSAQTITAPEGIDGYNPVNVTAVTSSIDSNIKAENIKEGVEILGVTGNVAELKGETTSVTPTTSQQTITPTSPHNGLTSVTVDAVTSSIDANIKPQNIKSGISILGVNGSLEAPTYYIERSKDNNNKLITYGDISVIDLTGVADISSYALYYAYVYNTYVRSFSAPTLVQITGVYACGSMFYECSGLNSIVLSGLTSISGNYACSYMFYNCTGLTTVNLSSLTTIGGASSCTMMFQNCSNLTSVDLSGLTTINGAGCCNYMFAYCTSLTELRFPSLKTVSSVGVFNNMLNGTSNVTVHFPSNLSSYQFSLGGTNTTVLFDLPSTE